MFQLFAFVLYLLLLRRTVLEARCLGWFAFYFCFGLELPAVLACRSRCIV
jgi:hypothetical protein